VPVLKKTLRQLINDLVLSQKDKPQTRRTVRQISRETHIHWSSLPRLFVKTCIWNVSRGAVHRSWQTRTVLLAWSTLSFWFRSSRSIPLTIVFFTGEKVFSVASLDNRQNEVSGSLRELLKKLSISFGAGTARSAAAWPPLNCACAPTTFEKLINTTLCPAFLTKFVCQPLCCVLFQIQTFLSKACPRRKLCSDVCCDEFSMPQIAHKSK